MQATLNILSNPFHPSLDRVQKPIQRKVRVNTLVNKHGINLSKPVMCYYNGSPLLRAQWSKTTVKDGDVVSFVYLPEGGGGSNPLKMVMMIAIAVYAPQLAAAMGGPGSVLGGAAGLGSVGMSMLSAGISFLGNTLVNALIPPPSPPKAQQQASMAAPSPTYSLNAQGNQARLGQAIPVLYGKIKIFPDFAAQPYTEFENNDQYLYQLFLITQGKALIEAGDIYIEDTPISSFGVGDYQIEMVQPGQKPTLFPTAVFNCGEVNGQELIDTSFGPFSLNPALTAVNKIAFDIALSKGLYLISDEGTFLTQSISFGFQAREIDDIGNPIGSIIPLGEYTISAASSKPIRKTYKFNVPPGRYSVTAYRTTAKNLDNRVANDLNWVGARGYSSEEIDYGDATLMVVKVKATNSISSQSSRKINCIAQRLLPTPTYNATTGAYEWGTPTPTSSMAWAVADMCRAEYGAYVSEQRFNVAQLITLNSQLAARGDEFNGVFDSSQTFWEALTIACRTCRTRPFVQGGMIHFVRDSLQSLPTALFTNRNIVKGSFKITYIMNSEDTADCVDVEYYDDLTWKPRIVRAALDEGSTSKPAKVKAFGITDRGQAFREGMAIAAANRYRRKEITFETELEGHIPALGDLIAIQSDIPEWGQHGEVADYTGGVVTSSEPLKWTTGAQHYVMLRRANGSSQGPLEVVKGATDDKFTFVVGNTPDFTLYSGYEKERTFISFGRSGQVVQLAKVLSITPRENTVQISSINEDVRVHSADGTAVPLDVYSYSIPAPTVRPILADFTITQTGSGSTPTIVTSWQPTPGASKYFIERSTDNENWETLGEITSTSFTFVANVGTIYIRVAAFGGVIGPYVTKSISVGAIPPPANVASGAISSNGQAYEITWTPVVDCDGYVVEIYNAGTLKRTFNTVTTNYTYSLDSAIADGGPWRALQVKIKATKGSVYSNGYLTLNGTNAAPAAPTVTVTPGVKSLSVTISNPADADYAGTLLYAGDTAGFTPAPGNLIYEGVGTFFLYSTTSAKYFKAAHYDTYGKTGLNYSTAVLGTPNTGFGVFLEYSVDGVTGWHSTFVTGDIFMRQKVDEGGTWSDAIRIIGLNPIVGTLTNESVVVATANDGTGGVFTNAGGTFKVFDGVTDKTGNAAVTYSVASSSGVSISIASTGVYTVTAMSADNGSATLRAVYSGVTVDKVYNIAKSKAGVIGVNGVDSTSYWMTASADALAKSIAGVFLPASLTFSAISKAGAGAPAAYAGRFKIYENGSATASYTSAVNESSKAYTPSSGSVKSIKAELYLAGGTTVKIDEQTIPVVNDGATGATGATGPAGANGTNGTNGSNGLMGDSIRLAYTKTALSSLSATPTTISTTGNASFPANDSWGTGTVWGSVPPTLVAGESLYQSDGIYSAAANQTIWGKPYLSSLKVGSLSAISANMGDITSGTITLDNAGHIKGGQTAYNTGTGFFLGYSGATYKFSIGNSTQGLTWDGAAMTIKGSMTGGSIALGTNFSVASDGTVLIRNASTGARLEVRNDVIKVYDASNVLRVKLGNLSA